MGFNKPCLVCGQLSRNSRCDTHQAQYDEAKNRRRDSNPQRKARKNSLYNNTYRKQAKWVRDTAISCHLCGIPFQPGDAIEADHVDAGNPNSELKPAHRKCNASRGSRPIPPTP